MQAKMLKLLHISDKIKKSDSLEHFRSRSLTAVSILDINSCWPTIKNITKHIAGREECN